jgi:hypothetical protein
VVGKELGLLHDEVLVDLDITLGRAEAIPDLGDHFSTVRAPRDGQASETVPAHPLPRAAIQGKEIAWMDIFVANIAFHQFLSHLLLQRYSFK